MPLQIRRGTTAERLSVTPLTGEPIFDTQLGQIFVGNGTTAGGVSPNIDAGTIEAALDSVGNALVNGVHQNISFIYGTTQDTANRIDATVSIATLLENLDLNDFNIVGNGAITINGRITGDIKGSIFSDDSTLLIDGTNGTVVGPIASSGLAANFDTNGFAIVSSDNRNILLTPDVGQRVIVNSNLEITGDVNKTGSLNILTTTLTSFGSNPSGIDGNVRILRNTYSAAFGQGLTYAQHHATTDVVPLSLVRTRNTGASPTAVVQGDEIANIEFYGHDGSIIREVASIRAVVDGAVTTGNIPGRIEFRTTNGGASIAAIIDSASIFKVDAIEGLTTSETNVKGNVQGNLVGSVFADNSTMIIDGTEGGRITAPSVSISEFLQLPVFADDVARLAAIPTAAKGMVIMMTAGTTPPATNQIQFFDGTSWNTL